MSICIHGVPIKIQCGKCEDKHRINLLESQVKALTEMYKEISCMVAGCQDHRIRQIDENRKISRRVEEIENGLFRRIGILGEALHLMSEDNHQLKKTPHKCHVCGGSGKNINVLLSMPPIYPNCKSCEGSGIVWW